ncbi:uncharacterized protein LOC110430580 isoform X4 [Sorghum bicolor]|uniref:uncharacterized protein LOC110430580 isoform X4 n=1 Tax=Sorghum bicolor TaxID=4558 RepID=UPI000B42653D|nr:uncharacterized protein LOC110430580 isoform X4 [Sorghum bicolor]|eukprot:XP_021304057.1 uncharacterized protein LOC110430580 isoform X4 [Sorghum bicolor]
MLFHSYFIHLHQLDTLKREYLSKKLFVAHLYFWWKWEYLSKNLSKKHGCLWFIFVFGGWTHRSVNICKRTMGSLRRLNIWFSVASMSPSLPTS